MFTSISTLAPFVNTCSHIHFLISTSARRNCLFVLLGRKNPTQFLRRNIQCQVRVFIVVHYHHYLDDYENGTDNDNNEENDDEDDEGVSPMSNLHQC